MRCLWEGDGGQKEEVVWLERRSQERETYLTIVEGFIGLRWDWCCMDSLMVVAVTFIDCVVNYGTYSKEGK